MNNLVDGLKIVKRLLDNQTYCEQSLCDGCNKARADVLAMVNELLTPKDNRVPSVCDPNHLNPAKGGNRAADDYW